MSEYKLQQPTYPTNNLKVSFSTSRKFYNSSLRIVMKVCVGITLSLVLFLIGYVFYRGLPKISWSLLTSSPSYIHQTMGILPDILNTFYLIILTLVFVVPLAVGAAIYLTEYANNQKIVRIVEFAAETLAGIPSIIYGLVGMLFFVQFCDLQTSLLAGALTLVMMNLPTIIRTCEESLKTVPMKQREAAYGLGATKWQMIKTVVLPGCMDGIITGMILAVGRVVGESAALLFTAGFAHVLHDFFTGIHSSGASLSVALYVYAKEQGNMDMAFAIAVVLMVLVLVINFTTYAITKHIKKRGMK